MPGASPRGGDTRGSRRPLPAPMLLHHRLTPPPVTVPVTLRLARLQGSHLPLAHQILQTGAAAGLSLPQRTGHGRLQVSKHVHDTC